MIPEATQCKLRRWQPIISERDPHCSLEGKVEIYSFDFGHIIFKLLVCSITSASSAHAPLRSSTREPLRSSTKDSLRSSTKDHLKSLTKDPLRSIGYENIRYKCPIIDKYTILMDKYTILAICRRDAPVTIFLTSNRPPSGYDMFLISTIPPQDMKFFSYPSQFLIVES